MGLGDAGRARPFGSAIDRWLAVGGGVAADGTVVGKPGELTRAELTLGLCERFGCLPSQLYAEDGDLLRLLAIERRGRRDETGG